MLLCFDAYQVDINCQVDFFVVGNSCIIHQNVDVSLVFRNLSINSWENENKLINLLAKVCW